LEEKFSNNDDDLLTPPPQHNNTLGLSPITPSKPLLQTVWRFLAKILQDDKKLRTAAAVGNIATVTEQLNYGIDPDAKNESTLKTALYCAAEHGHVDIILPLLERGASVNAVQKDRFSPLHAAARNGHEKVVKVLLDSGALVEAETKNGGTALYIAAEHGHEKVVNVLLGSGVNKEVRDDRGQTALD
jgi:ankyrin repeat protein